MRDLIDGNHLREHVLVSTSGHRGGLGPVGLYGKLPSHGDFLRRRVSDAFVQAWDAWLQDCVAASHAALGDRWLDVYLTSPAWRFAFAAGVCAPVPLVGLMVPSVDRVGRYFPFTLVAELPPTVSLLTVVRASALFLDAAERLVLETLEADPVDFEDFDERVLRLGRETPGLDPSHIRLDPQAATAMVNEGRYDRWHVPVGARPQLTTAFEQMLTERLTALYAPLGVWWTEGSSIVEPSCLVVKGLPAPETFAALLDGSWSDRQWQTVPAEVTAAPESEDAEDAAGQAAPQFQSAAASDVGRVRRVNQDAFIERSDVGMWAVADGLGGFSEGDVASRMVCDALADLVPDSGFEQTVDAACRRLSEVNAHLHRKATRSEHQIRSCSTVVAVFTRGGRCAVLWAGDSRAYRWRSGQFEQLTRDHAMANETNVVTRAVGGEEVLALEVRYDRVKSGDRFLLCSDGLTRVLPAAQIRGCLGHEDIRAAVDSLIAATLDAGAPDNVTALIVEASEARSASPGASGDEPSV